MLKKLWIIWRHYFREPDLSWDTKLEMTKIELELIPDSVMFIFFEKGARDKSSYISNRHNKAKYLKSFDPKQESKLIIYLNANILYAYAMPKFLPRSELKLIDLKEFHLNRYTSNSSKG